MPLLDPFHGVLGSWALAQAGTGSILDLVVVKDLVDYVDESFGLAELFIKEEDWEVPVLESREEHMS